MKKNIFLICAIIISLYLLITLIGIILNIFSDLSQINFKVIIELAMFSFMAFICWYGFYTEKNK